MNSVIWDKGIRLAHWPLWLDGEQYSQTTFLSSAKGDQLWRHQRAVCTEGTRLLVRLSSSSFAALLAPFRKPVRIGALELTTYPSGAMPGAALAMVKSPMGTFLYVNSFVEKGMPLAEKPELPKGDVLVVKAAYGSPIFQFPPRERLYDQIAALAQANLEKGLVPVYLGSTVGKAQELVYCLRKAGFDVVAHTSVIRYDKAFRTLGFDPGPVKAFKGTLKKGQVLVYPERLRWSRAIKHMKSVRLIWASGLSAEPGTLKAMKVDDGVPLSSHPDFRGLLELVEASGASVVYAVGTRGTEFANHLRRKGVEAYALHRMEQLTLF